jgi:hypothetical protein
VNETSITIKDLLSCSIYEFTVFAENTKLKGLPLQLLVGTLPKVTVFPSMRGVNITLSNNCNGIKVFMEMIDIICTNEWCRNQNRAPKRTNPDYDTITISGLTPFSDYRADLRVGAFFMDWHYLEAYIKRKNFRTKPTSN